jgi:bifunctional enzyme CysN/CysC
VDDGKSTLIGRLLWDASDLFDDQRETLVRSTRRVLDGTHLDYSLLVDGLLAEREQGITIDIAWRFFDNLAADGASTRFVMIDSPGHEQYTRNMASGASHADVAVMLIDARHGIKRQTRRHAALLDLFGVRRVVLAVNKMDLVGWSQARFDEIEADFAKLRTRFRFDAATAIPVAAVTGDNIARHSPAMAWYQGPTLVEALGAVNTGAAGAARSAGQPFRLPVQTVLRDGQDFRGLAGTVSSGAVSVGDTVVDVLSGQQAKVARIATMDRDHGSAITGQAVALVLDRDIDVSRGAVLAKAGNLPVAARDLDVRLIWMAGQAYDSDASYLLRTATDLIPVGLNVQGHLDLDTLAQVPATGCGANDIAIATLSLNRPAALDAFADLPATGSFVLVDAVTGATVAGGIITGLRAGGARKRAAPATFKLTREMLAAGLCRDLGESPADKAEFERRWTEVGNLLRLALGDGG